MPPLEKCLQTLRALIDVGDVQGNEMNFAGIEDPRQRADLLAFGGLRR
jgi:hypothetical protein